MDRVWGRIRFGDASNDSSTIDYAVIRYAGHDSSDYAVIDIFDASPTIRNSQISQNRNEGVNIHTAVPTFPAQPTLTGNTFSANQSYALSSDINSQPLLSSNTITGNVGNGMAIWPGSLQTTKNWNQTSVVYIIPEDLSVAAGGQLNIAPGAIIKLRDDASLLVDGNLQAIGTAGQHIYFTSWHDDSVGGDTNGDGGATVPDPTRWDRVWGRIRFGDASNDSSTIDYAVIRYAGHDSSDYAVIDIFDASPTIRNSQISQNRNEGVNIHTAVPTFPAQPTLTGNTFSANQSYALSSDINSQPLLSSNTITGNVGNGMAIWPGSLQTTKNWNQTSVVYIIPEDLSVAAGGQLNIAPGAIIKLRDDASLLVDGNLQAIGTAGQHIYFTSWHDDSVGGDTNGDGGATVPDPTRWDRVWGRIRFGDASNDSSTIDYAVIRYAGHDSSDYAVIDIFDASPTIRNSQISQNRNEGVNIHTAVPTFPAQPTLTGNTFSANQSYALSSDINSQPLLSSNTITGNVGNGMAIWPGSLQTTKNWNQTSVVYIIPEDLSVAAGGQLNIAPGAIIKLRDDASLLVDGNLQAIGTAGQHIYFTSWHDDSVGGDTNGDGGATVPDPTRWDRVWGRIRFGDASNDSSTIDYAVIRYAGHDSSDYAVIDIFDASPTIRNTDITLNRKHGISTSSAVSPAQPTLVCMNIESNRDHGLYNESPATVVNATQLWWGHPSGPYHATLNPGGQGNKVSNGVSFSPWRSSRCIDGVVFDNWVYLPLVKR